MPAAVDRLRATMRGPVVFIGVDPNYALGPEAWLSDYSVVCRHETAVLRLMEERGIDVFCLQRVVGQERLPGRATAGVAGHTAVAEWLSGKTRAGQALSILVFKPSAQVETLAAQHGWHVLGAPASVARPMENKVNFFRLLDERALPHPAWRQVDLATESYADVARQLGPRFVLQAAHGFSGNRTFFVGSAADHERAASALSRRRARASQMVDGCPMTMNACVVGPGRIRTGPLFHQVTGVPECTVYPLGACGNDWAAATAPAAVRDKAAVIARSVGETLSERGFRGIFGMDFIATEEETVVAIECNPRLVSSVPMASALECEVGAVPLLVSHLLATAGHETDAAVEDVRTPIAGSQLVLHNLTGSVARVHGALSAGIYRIENDALCFVRPALKVTECTGEEEFLLLPPADRHVLQAAGECARVQMRGAVLDFGEGFGKGCGSLNARAKRIVKIVYDALALRAELSETPQGDAEE